MELEELFDEVRYMDVADPASIDKVLSYYEELNEEAEAFMEMLTVKLKHASITWRQPWYQLSKCLTRPLKETDENSEELYQSGTFTRDEIKIVENNWCKFVKEYNVPDKLICVARWRNREHPYTLKGQMRIFVVAYLANGLQRNLYQVYKFIVSHYGGKNRGPFSKDEQKIMDICFYHQPKRAAIYASTVLARECRRIYTRLHEAFNGKRPKGKTKWSLPLASKFLNLLLQYTGEPLEELKYKKIEKEVWLKLENDFEKPKEYLMYFWNTRLYSQLFVKCNVTLRHLQRKIFKVLRTSPYKLWHDIRWKEVLEKFPEGFTINLLYSASVRIVYGYRKHSKRHLRKLVEYGLLRTRPNCRITHKNKRLKTLKLNSEGNLETVQYDTKLSVTYF